jgi:hypothetical protein
VPWVNGISLIEMAREVERPFATREGHPELAGGYRGLPSSVALGAGSVLLASAGSRHQRAAREARPVPGTTVRAEGLEPPRVLAHRHLKPARLPISPRPRQAGILGSGAR